ncbi:MAG: GrxA family glutaredoxin [Oleiphilaceae bacterium]|nr:GrxA family glutaredoxin [Oleiphilaceae bacterium]
MQSVTIYGRSSCGFCVRARQLCESRGLPHRYVDIEQENISKDDLSKLTGTVVRTVPQIFVGETPVGGYTEFVAYVSKEGATSVS